MKSSKRPSGMFGFTIAWLGQIVSVLASMMTQFALTIWAFEKTGIATGGILVLQAIGILKDSLPDHDQLQKMESIPAD